jgi:hypothetical protein
MPALLVRLTHFFNGLQSRSIEFGYIGRQLGM